MAIVSIHNTQDANSKCVTSNNLIDGQQPCRDCFIMANATSRCLRERPQWLMTDGPKSEGQAAGWVKKGIRNVKVSLRIHWRHDTGGDRQTACISSRVFLPISRPTLIFRNLSNISNISMSSTTACLSSGLDLRWRRQRRLTSVFLWSRMLWRSLTMDGASGMQCRYSTSCPMVR